MAGGGYEPELQPRKRYSANVRASMNMHVKLHWAEFRYLTSRETCRFGSVDIKIHGEYHFAQLSDSMLGTGPRGTTRCGLIFVESRVSRNTIKQTTYYSQKYETNSNVS